MDPADIHHVTTDDELKALAHPLRLRLLGLLRADGPATASGLGERLGESSGVTSYHLRYLAERDFVKEDRDLGNRRERWWRAAQQSTEWNPVDFLDSREGRAADLAFRREHLRFSRAVVDNWMVEESTWPREWIGAAIEGDALLRLSVDELRDFGDDYRALITKYAALSKANEADPPANPTEARDESDDAAGPQRVLAIFHAVPVRELNP